MVTDTGNLERIVSSHEPFKYEITLSWSEADGSFVAEAPELSRVHGDTQEAALANVNQAMALCIDTAREFGDPVPEPRDASRRAAGRWPDGVERRLAAGDEARRVRSMRLGTPVVRGTSDTVREDAEAVVAWRNGSS